MIRRTLWLMRALTSAGFIVPTVTTYEDNKAAIHIAQNHTIGERTRHMHNKDMYIRTLVKAKHIKLEYIKSENNIADFLTKILPLSAFRKFRDQIMGIM